MGGMWPASGTLPSPHPLQVAACRWGYQCSVCLLAGDLLCCEVRPALGRGWGSWLSKWCVCWPETSYAAR